MRTVMVMLLLGAQVLVCAQTPAPQAAPRTAAISGVAVAPGPVVTITANGPLALPRVGVLHSPDRIYLDLAGVSTRTVTTNGDGAVISSIRVAQHGSDPLVARVVIDLAQPCSYSLNQLQLTQGHLEIALVPKSSAAAAVGPTSAAPLPKVTPEPAAPPAARQPRGDPSARRYLARLKTAVDAAANLRGVLEDIDRGAQVSTDRLASARTDLGHLQAVVESVEPPHRFEDAHGLLKSVAAFASTALDLESRSTGEVPKNASSAAAGALMMLDRAMAELDAADSSSKDQFAARTARW